MRAGYEGEIGVAWNGVESGVGGLAGGAGAGDGSAVEVGVGTGPSVRLADVLELVVTAASSSWLYCSCWLVAVAVDCSGYWVCEERGYGFGRGTWTWT